MALKKIINPYIVISLISVIVGIAGLFLYAQNQQKKIQTPTKVYKELTEAEETIVKKNIKAIAQQQKEKEHKKEDKPQSTVDDTPRQYDNLDNLPEFTPPKTVVTNTKADVPDIEKLIQKDPKMGIMKSGPDSAIDPKTIFSQLPHLVGVQGNGEGTTIQINSREDLERVIAQLEASDDATHRHMAQTLRNHNVTGDVRITFHTSVPLDQ